MAIVCRVVRSGHSRKTTSCPGLRLMAPGWIAATNFGTGKQADMVEGLLGIAFYLGPHKNPAIRFLTLLLNYVQQFS